MQEHLIIIGGVAAGTKAAAKARKEKPDLKISIYTDDQHISYSACSLPYYIEGIIKDENRLIIRSPEVFKAKYNIDVHMKHKVTKIHPDIKTIEIENLKTGEKSEDKYTKLLIATGARAFIPDIEGVNLNNVFTLRNITDAVAIKKAISKAQKAVIIGAGYIGLEMLEAFYNSGLDVTLFELTPQILPALDPDIADQIQEYLEKEKNVKIVPNNKIVALIGDKQGNVKQIQTGNGDIIEADLVLLAIGVKPNIEIAKLAGIEIGITGAIKVNDTMQTNISDIYAAGDCAEQIHLVTGEPVWIPLGSTANKQGRVAGINITGGNTKFKGVLGSHISKVFDYTNTGTGLTEKQAKKCGFDYETITLTYRDRSGYFLNAENITIKLIADKKTRKLLGTQITGKGDADKRANIAATALAANMTVDEISEIDLTYAPPYSPVIDPIITAAQLLQEKMDNI